jgi:Icc-related predicted phosphoesterase
MESSMNIQEKIQLIEMFNNTIKHRKEMREKMTKLLNVPGNSDLPAFIQQLDDEIEMNLGYLQKIEQLNVT